jgi:hypothetical protein
MERASRELLRFYSALKYALEKHQEEAVTSVFLGLQEVKTTNQLASLLRDGALRSSDFDNDEIRGLQDQGLVRETDIPFRVVITLRGVWLVESERNVIDVGRVVEFLDGKAGSVFRPKSLGAKEKVILLAILSVRAFSPTSAIDLLSDNLTKDHWREVLDSSAEQLVTLGVIKAAERSRLFRSGGNEHPVSNLIRHSDAISKKTQGMYVAPGKQKYYLAVTAGEVPDRARIETILKKILTAQLTVSQGEELVDFMRRIAYAKASLLFDPIVHRFANPLYDDVIRDAVMNVVVQSGDSADPESRTE